MTLYFTTSKVPGEQYSCVHTYPLLGNHFEGLDLRNTTITVKLCNYVSVMTCEILMCSFWPGKIGQNSLQNTLLSLMG